MEIEQLRTFLAVLEQESFSRAGTRLRLGQSTVSFHVKALEKSVGARLLDRRGGTVRPTAAGRLLRDYATRLLALRDEALERVREDEGGESGRVRIAASTIPAEYLLPALLAKFLRTHPRVTFSVTVSDSRGAVAALLGEACDLALTGARVPERRITYTPFAEDEIVLVGPVPNRWARDGHLTRSALARVPLVDREEGSGTREAVERLLPPETEVTAHVQVGSTEAVRRCVLEGVGLAFLSRYAVAEDLKARRLAIVRLPGTPVRRRFYAARLRTVTLSAAARAFAAMLKIR